MSTEVEYYQVLGVPRDATPEEMRNAYFELAKRLHPDTSPNPASKEDFLLVQRAYEILSNPERRQVYDATLPKQKPISTVSLDLKLSRSSIPLLKESQVVYALVEITCTAEPDRTKTPPRNICLVVDRSTSMKGDRMDTVKQNIEQLIKKLAPNDTFGLVAFSDRAEVIIPQTRAPELSRQVQKIHQIESSGGTEIFQGLDTGINELRFHSNRLGTRHLILLTDGHTYGDEEACYKTVKQAAMEGMVVSGLGIGHEWNDSFLDQLTSLSGGETRFIIKPHDLSRYFEERISAVENIYAHGMSYEFTMGPGVELRDVYRLSPGVNLIPPNSPIILGNLCFGKNQTILFEFMVPPLADGTDSIRLAEGRLRMDIPSEGGLQRFLLSIKSPVSSEVTMELPPEEIIDALSRLTLYRLQERARQEVEKGNISQATKHLQYLATHLLSYGDRELAHIVLMEAEHIQQSRRFSQDGDKRIKYGTRALLLPSGLEQKNL